MWLALGTRASAPSRARTCEVANLPPAHEPELEFFATPFATPRRGETSAGIVSYCFVGEPVGIRTRDLLIKSQLLYRLSYGL
jgi:hypothetical protein